MKRWRVILMVAMVALLLTGCCLSHKWADATCEEPKTCTKCGKTEGEALGHKWVDADCTKPKTCSVCGETEGEALGHEWVDADCTKPKTCSVCGETEGEALGHEWVDADCTKPKTCSVCGETEGEALGHEWVDADCTKPKTCSACGETEGEALGHKWVDADCTKPKTCSVCGETEGEALGHKWVDADCTKPKTCSACGETEGEALGHKWEPATCTAPKTCSVCNEITGSALGHQVETKVRFDFTNSLAIGEEVCSRCAMVINSRSVVLTTLTEDSVFVPSAEEFYQRLQHLAQLNGFKGEIRLAADGDGDVVCRFELNGKRIASMNFKDTHSNWIPYDSKDTQYAIHSLFLYGSNNADDFIEAWVYVMLACDPTQEMNDSLLDLMQEMLNFSPVKNGIQYQFDDMSGETESFWVSINVQ